MSRSAFPAHVQLSQLWVQGVANSWFILKRVLIGYLCVPIMFAYEISLYSYTRSELGWWVPTDMLADPNILSHYLPWLNPLVHSLQAGTWEEAVFRIVPISLTVLFCRSKQFGSNTRLILLVIAFAIQAVVFGGAHASYPTQPSYGRLVELIVPSVGFGLLFTRYGFMTGALTHFVFDVVWMALPLAQAEQAHGDLLLVTILTLTPLWLVSLHTLSTALSARADAAQPAEVAEANVTCCGLKRELPLAALNKTLTEGKETEKRAREEEAQKSVHSPSAGGEGSENSSQNEGPAELEFPRSLLWSLSWSKQKILGVLSVSLYVYVVLYQEFLVSNLRFHPPLPYQLLSLSLSLVYSAHMYIISVCMSAHLCTST